MIPLAAALATQSRASEPALDLPPGVRVEQGPDRWTVVVGGRQTSVPAPRDPADLEAFRALVASLAGALTLAPGDPAARRALDLVPPPSPRPLPEPAEAPPPGPPSAEIELLPDLPLTERGAPEPEPMRVALPPPPPARRWSASVGPELVVRPGIRAGAGFAARLDGGVGPVPTLTRVSVRPPRATGFTRTSELTEVVAETGPRAEIAPGLELVGAAGGALRVWTEPGNLAAWHVMPHAALGVGGGLRLGSTEGEWGAAIEVDLMPTRIEASDGYSASLWPIGMRVDLRLGPARE